MMKQLAAAGLVVAATLGTGASAFAGERTGEGKPTPIDSGTRNGKAVPAAICAFSGLEDFDQEGDVQPGEVQTPHGESAFDVVFPPGSARICSVLNHGHGWAGEHP